MKPLEFKIEEIENPKQTESYTHKMVVYYDDGTLQVIPLGYKPKGLELNRHYSIADIYGYQVVDDRKGL